jgi:ferric-dicitrate binding protein FerR (iron transport regulator)
VEVEVLGTSFNVNNRRGRVQVMLNTGKVKLFRPLGGAAIDMQPRDFVEVQEAGTQVLRKEVAPDRYISWVQQKLMFDNTPLREITQTLEDTYGLHVVFREERLQDLPFTGDLPNQKVDLFLRILGESLDVDILRQGQTIIISKPSP